MLWLPSPIFGWPNLWGQQLGVCDHPKSCGATIGCSVPPPPNLWGCHLGVCGHPKSFGATIGHCVVLSSPQTMGYGCGSAAIPNLLGPLVAGFPLPQSMGPSLGGLQPPHIFWGHRWALCCRSPPNLWGCQLGVCGHPKSCGATIGCLVIHPPPQSMGPSFEVSCDHVGSP